MFGVGQLQPKIIHGQSHFILLREITLLAPGGCCNAHYFLMLTALHPLYPASKLPFYVDIVYRYFNNTDSFKSSVNHHAIRERTRECH